MLARLNKIKRSSNYRLRLLNIKVPMQSFKISFEKSNIVLLGTWHIYSMRNVRENCPLNCVKMINAVWIDDAANSSLSLY